MKLSDSIQKLKGIGTKKSYKFSKLGIFTINDIICYFPKSYENRQNLKKIKDVQNGEKTAVVCTICGSPEEISTKSRIKILKIPIKDDTKKGYAVFFNSTYLKNVFSLNDKYCFYGKINIANNEIQISHPEYCNIEKQNIKDFCRIVPLYGLTKGLYQKDILNPLYKLLIENKFYIEEYLPEKIIKDNKLCSINYAIKNIHFPASVRALKVAKFRLIFEELFFLQLALLIVKRKYIFSKNGIKFKVFDEVNRLINSLPFKLTNSQTKVLNEIIDDMMQNKVMNRLVQGDVGSGKTIIALIAAYICFLNRYQTAFMVPTEILAEQHYNTFKAYLESFGVKIGILTKSTNQRKEMLEKIKNGDLDIVIGTHALIQEGVSYKKLGLVITDEQHRFGVRQRTFLSKKGENPDILVMTATPIPRTLSLILYGDLDISIIDELPPGRKEIKTYHINEKKLFELYEFIKKEINKGRQAYIVCPLVDDSEKINAKSAIYLFKELKESYFKDYSLGIIHGKMNSDEKDKIMRKFECGEIDVLITTTVIEVGINVENATIMVIQNAERFGLAQLHQLRGRVGRGKFQSYCFLVSNSNSEITKKRIEIMKNSNDGFVIAEKDLKLRGPGDFFGTKQHGLPELKIANLFKHVDILKKAQKSAWEILENDSKLKSVESTSLKLKLIQNFGNIFENFTI